MAAPSPSDVTRLLVDWSGGDRQAAEKLIPLVYDELHRLAERHMRRERPGHTLQPTALVNEAYFRLVKQDRVQWHNRAQFFGLAAQAMRRILVDHARRRRYAKRRGVEHQIPLEEAAVPSPERSPRLLMLDEALQRLATVDARKSRVIEMRIFGGLTIEETAAALGVSNTTVINEYRTARAWLYRELRQAPAGPESQDR